MMLRIVDFWHDTNVWRGQGSIWHAENTASSPWGWCSVSSLWVHFWLQKTNKIVGNFFFFLLFFCLLENIINIFKSFNKHSPWIETFTFCQKKGKEEKCTWNLGYTFQKWTEHNSKVPKFGPTKGNKSPTRGRNSFYGRNYGILESHFSPQLGLKFGFTSS